MNARRDTARRWVLQERKTDEEVAHLILVGYDEGPARWEMEGYVNEARAELRSEGADRASAADAPVDAASSNVTVLADERVTFEQLEKERRALAENGEAHGYDQLAKACLTSSSTVQRRYKGRQPPGTPIRGICERVRAHAHWET